MENFFNKGARVSKFLRYMQLGCDVKTFMPNHMSLCARKAKIYRHLLGTDVVNRPIEQSEQGLHWHIYEIWVMSQYVLSAHRTYLIIAHSHCHSSVPTGPKILARPFYSYSIIKKYLFKQYLFIYMTMTLYLLFQYLLV